MVSKPQLSPETDLEIDQTAWIIFSNDTDIRMLRLLKRGFRHCFIIMLQDQRWILIDPRSNKTDVNILPHPANFNFPRYFVSQGKTVMKLPPVVTPKRIMMPFCFSCVETVKRMIGLHRYFILTPYQLYRYLNKLSSFGSTKGSLSTDSLVIQPSPKGFGGQEPKRDQKKGS
jgi:hypothetical protein